MPQRRAHTRGHGTPVVKKDSLLDTGSREFRQEHDDQHQRGKDSIDEG